MLFVDLLLNLQGNKWIKILCINDSVVKFSNVTFKTKLNFSSLLLNHDLKKIAISVSYYTTIGFCFQYEKKIRYWIPWNNLTGRKSLKQLFSSFFQILIWLLLQVGEGRWRSGGIGYTKVMWVRAGVVVGPVGVVRGDTRSAPRRTNAARAS